MKRFNGVTKIVLTAFISVVLTLAAVTLILGFDITHLFTQIGIARKVVTIDSFVRNSAIYSDDKAVADKFAQGYIDTIDDDYAFYFDENAYSLKKEEWEGLSTKMLGIKISKQSEAKYCSVVYVDRQSPSHKAGLLSGDLLLSANGKSLKGKTPEQAIEIINVAEQKSIDFSVKRGTKTLNISIVPSDFVSDSVTWHAIGNIGYIQIFDFNDTTPTQFDEALEALQKGGAKALVFDLRNNGGGTVTSCISILDKLCPKGDLLRLKYKNGEIKTDAVSDEAEVKLPMAVIVNGESASASEIFAMTLREFGKAKLVGEKTYGKGISQTTYSLYDGTAVKFTTATVVDSHGKTYHKIGLTPDIEVIFNKAQNTNFYFLTQKQDTQLQAALKSVKEQIK